MTRPDPGRIVALLLLLLAAGCSPTPSDRLEVADARIRDLIPGQDKTVAYLTLRNHGASPVTFIGAETAVARTVELHTTQRDGEVMRMRRLPGVEIPAGGTVRFEPGGHHLMLFGVRSLHERNQVRLLFADGSSQTVPFDRIGIGAH